MTEQQSNNVPIFNDPVQIEVRNEVLKIQSDEIRDGRSKIDVLDKDISTVRRQVEILENTGLKKGNTIFMLKTTLSYLIIMFIPILLVIKGHINWYLFAYIAAAASILYVVVMYYTIVSRMNRDPNRFNLKKFVDNMPPSARPKKCVSNLTKRLTPEAKEISEKTKELDNVTKKIAEMNSQDKEIEVKREELQRQLKQLENKYQMKFPEFDLNSDIERNLALRTRFSI